MRRRLAVFVLALAGIAAAAAAAVVLNVVLLGHAAGQSDPVGRLSARTHVPVAPAWTVRPTAHDHERDGADD